MAKQYLKNVFYGFLAWLIPFAAPFLLVSYFKKINANFLKEGIIVGIVWQSRP